MTTPTIRAAALLALAGLASACGDSLARQQGDQMLKELKAIREALERVSPPPGQPPADPKASLNDLGGPFLGRADAPVTLVEFTDLQCPYCNRFTATTFEQIKAAYIDTGKVRFASRDFPLDFHAQALPAARAARCGGEQGKYFEMRLALLRDAARLSAEVIAAAAREVGLDMAAFTPCAADTRHDAAIRRDLETGMRLGIEGTPSFVLGRTTPNGVEGVLVVGAQPFQAFDTKIKELLGAR